MKQAVEDIRKILEPCDYMNEDTVDNAILTWCEQHGIFNGSEIDAVQRYCAKNLY